MLHTDFQQYIRGSELFLTLSLCWQVHENNGFTAFIWYNTWAATWQNQQNGCASSEDSDQLGHPPSLIRVFAVRMKKAWVLSYPLSAQRRLRSDWADAQVDLSLCWAHTHSVGFVMLQLIFSCYIWNSKTVASYSSWAGLYESHLVTLFWRQVLPWHGSLVLIIIGFKWKCQKPGFFLSISRTYKLHSIQNGVV